LGSVIGDEFKLKAEVYYGRMWRELLIKGILVFSGIMGGCRKFKDYTKDQDYVGLWGYYC